MKYPEVNKQPVDKVRRIFKIGPKDNMLLSTKYLKSIVRLGKL